MRTNKFYGKLICTLLIVCIFAGMSFPGTAAKIPAVSDVTGDREITVADARAVLRAAIGLEEPVDKMDTDGDGKITVDDARTVLRFAICLPESDIDISYSMIKIGSFEPDRVRPYCLNRDKISEPAFHPMVFLANSRKELESYVDILINSENYYLSEAHKKETRDEYLRSYDSYTNKFFEENTLVLIAFESGSGFFTFRVLSVECGAKSLCVTLMQDPVYGMVTCDMAYWTAAITLDKTTASRFSEFDAIMLRP